MLRCCKCMHGHHEKDMTGNEAEILVNQTMSLKGVKF